jgi:PAS domain-containing protein
MAQQRATTGGSATGHRGELSRFLHQHRATIIAEWSETVRTLSKARTLSTPALVNHIPSLLDAIAKRAEQMAAGAPEIFPEYDAVLHALQRLDKGFDLEEVAREYGVLRRTILGLLDAHAMTLSAGESQFLNAAIDTAMGQAVSGYAKAQQRIIQGMDRVSEATLTSANVEEMLARLLQVFLDTTAPVDIVVLLLREGDHLRVRAAAGVDADLRGRSLRMGEGFAGTIATERRPMAIRDAGTDPIVVDPWFRQAGVKAVYGVPLLEGGEVIGVAHMGSRSASEFSYEQQVLFRAMASRATLLMSHALTVARERAASIAARAFARSATLDEAAMQLLAGVGEAFGWHAGVYWRVESGVLRYRQGWTTSGLDLSGFHSVSREWEFERGVGLPGRAWASGAVEWVADVEKDAGMPRKVAAAAAGLQSAIAFPLSTGDETLGVLEFFSRESRVAVDEAVEMTSGMTRHLPEFMRRIHAQEQLRQSEAQKTAMLDVALDCIITMGADGRVVAWNGAAERTFGYTAAEAVGQELGTLIIPPELRNDHRAGVAHYLATGTPGI